MKADLDELVGLPEEDAAPARAIKNVPGRDDLAQIQGLVYSGWGDHRFAGYLFATLNAGRAAEARAWLGGLRVSPATLGSKDPGDRLNVALSPQGLAKLGVPAETLAALPQEAKRGMATRARILGDDPPDGWEMGRDNELDVLVMVFARTEPRREELMREHRVALESIGAAVRPDELSFPLDGKEHFGFADGVSQPFLGGKVEAGGTPDHAIDTGEILLGYRNAYGKLPSSPQLGGFDLGENGTYLVFRKLHQHVDRFWSYVAARAKEIDPDRAEALTELLGAKLVGRWKSGAPLVLSPERDDPAYAAPDKINAFNFHDVDPQGERCPISSHIRRSNPRDARGSDPDASMEVVNRHRILRRGRSYGARLSDADALAGRDDKTARGLYFICLQASIARGFEFIQQTWLSNPGFNGLFCEPDPIMGNGDGDSDVTIPMSPLRLRLANVPILVTVMGGGYFFMPSLAALKRLAAG